MPNCSSAGSTIEIEEERRKEMYECLRPYRDRKQALRRSRQEPAHLLAHRAAQHRSPQPQRDPASLPLLVQHHIDNCSHQSRTRPRSAASAGAMRRRADRASLSGADHERHRSHAARWQSLVSHACAAQRDRYPYQIRDDGAGIPRDALTKHVRTFSSPPRKTARASVWGWRSAAHRRAPPRQASKSNRNSVVARPFTYLLCHGWAFDLPSRFPRPRTMATLRGDRRDYRANC